MRDGYEREIDYLRLSLTDRCQLRCRYCLPETGVKWTPQDQLLTDAEIKEIVAAFAKLGVKKLKLTGGEPLLRPNLVPLIRELKAIPGIVEITLTTNGVGLAPMVADLVTAGLDGVNISLDTLDHNRYQFMTRKNQLTDVLAGLERAVASQILRVKINCVLIQELNKDEILQIAQIAQNNPVHVRFIEWMPMGNEQGFTAVSEEVIKQILKKQYGTFQPCLQKIGNGPARYIEVSGFMGKIGFIFAVSHHFCDTCNRVRVTSDGFLKTCLYFNKGVDLKSAIENGNLEAQIRRALTQKPSKHYFKTQQHEVDREQKSMIQIGG